eukprot:1947170-Amphidinium_carterae.1
MGVELVGYLGFVNFGRHPGSKCSTPGCPVRPEQTTKVVCGLDVVEHMFRISPSLCLICRNMELPNNTSQVFDANLWHSCCYGAFVSKIGLNST